MSFKIKQRELDEMTDRIANECADWDDVVWVLTDYLPLSVLDAVCDWDEVNLVGDCDLEDLGIAPGLAEFTDGLGWLWSKCECGQFDRIDDDDDLNDEESHVSAAYLMTRGPIRRFS